MVIDKSPCFDSVLWLHKTHKIVHWDLHSAMSTLDFMNVLDMLEKRPYQVSIFRILDHYIKVGIVPKLFRQFVNSPSMETWGSLDVSWPFVHAWERQFIIITPKSEPLFAELVHRLVSTVLFCCILFQSYKSEPSGYAVLVP